MQISTKVPRRPGREPAGVRTPFGELLEEYRLRRGLSQEQFATRMRAAGYPRFSQRMYSHTLYWTEARVLPCFFPLVADILVLDDGEREHLLREWLALVDYERCVRDRES